MENLEKIFRQIDKDFEGHIRALRDYIRQPSISLEEGGGVLECAEMTLDFIRACGAQKAELVPLKNGNPVVYGRLDSKNPKAKTFIMYGMYDVMPVVGEKWITPPFDAEVVDAKKAGTPKMFGPVVVGRGARNQKGPFIAFVKAVESMMRAVGDVPVNIIFAIEGEEELGSPNFWRFRDAFMKELRNADAAHFHSATVDEVGRHLIHRGMKGILMCELEVKGGDWGGPAERALFAADIKWVDPPICHLVAALRSMLDEDGNVLVEGFFDKVRPMDASEKREVAKIRRTFDEKSLKKAWGVRKFKRGKPAKSYVKDYIMDPLINIDGIIGGYTGPFVKTNLPWGGVAKLDVRIVPDMTPEDAEKKIRRHLKKMGFGHADFRVLSSYPWSRTPSDSPLVKAEIRATGRFKKEAIVWPTHPAVGPLYLFNRPPLNLPITLCGLCHGGNIHSANEYIAVEGMREGAKWVAAMLHDFAASD